MKKRFSKQTLAQWIFRNLRDYEEEYGFKRHSNGWAQVEGKPAVIQRAYGRYSGWLDVAEAFDLEEPKQ